VSYLWREGETDWKVLVIDVTDPRADEFNDISDVQRLLPGFTMATYEWFRTYKIPAGKPANEFAFGGEAKGRAYALDVVAENYEFWQRLATGAMPPKGDKYNISV
jgi:inorganic pyrophosphatase